MSFDEFPPDSEMPRQVADETPNVPQEASTTDAPPARTTRQRRGTRTGTDAASSATTTEPPTRSRRSRTNQTQSEPTEPVAAPEITSAAPETQQVEAISPKRPPRQRRSLSAISDDKASTQETSPSGLGVSPPEVNAPPLATPAELPNSKSRRPQRGKKTTLETTESQSLAQPPAIKAVDDILEQLFIDDEEKSGSSLPAPSGKSRVRRPSRSRETIQREPTETQIDVVVAPKIETPPDAESASPESGVAMTEEEARSARSRRQRPSRNRRGAKPEGAATPLTEIVPSSASEAVTTSPQDSTDLAEGDSASRNRRNRQRNRRGTRPDPTNPPDALVEEIETAAQVAPKAPVEEPVDVSVGSHLLTRNGVPQLYINGKFFAPLLFFGSVDGVKNQQTVLSEVKKAAANGIHLHSTLIELPAPLSDTSEALDEIDRRLRAILDADPDGYVMPRIVFVPARGWKREYPTEISTYGDGSTGDPSISSERFWREAEHSLEMLVTHLKEYEWGSRIFGYHLERGEWFQPSDTGYDRSMANRDAFRDWLREKYKNNLVALRAAWYDGDVQFHTAEIPLIPPKPTQNRAFYEPRRERRIMDFNEFTSESAASRLISLAKAIKKAANRQSLVSVCYGYTFEFGHGFSGHLSLSKVLASTAIDLVCGPPSYRDRKPGGGASLPAPIDSFTLHGKLWLSEDDTKTYLSPTEQDMEDFNPRMTDRFQTEQAHSRAMGRALSQSTGIGFMDLWGEGWLDEDHIWEKVGGFSEQYSHCLNEPNPGTSAEIVCLIDEKSLIHLQRGEPFFRKMTNGLRDTLQRSGTYTKTYLQSDLLEANFPTDAKLYVFLTPFRLTAPQRAAIKEKLHGGNRTLVWLYAPGSCEERPSMAGAGEEAIGGTIGITLRPQEWNAEVGSKLTDARHQITERLNSRDIGIRERLNPSYYAEPEDAIVLAEYVESGLPSLVVKKMENWQSVFVGDPAFTVDLLRGICKFAGVHLWVGGGEDTVSIGNGWLTIHANRDGHRILRTPQPTGVFDQSEGRLIGETIKEHRYFLRNGTTKTFCVGDIETLRGLGLVQEQVVVLPEDIPIDERPLAKIIEPNENPVESKPLELPEIRKTEPLAPTGELELSKPIEVNQPSRMSEDMLTLQAVLNLDLSQVGDLPLDDLEEYEFDAERAISDPSKPRLPLPAFLLDGEPIASGRRRRRRGGRGRGRGKEDDELSETESAEEGSPADVNPETSPVEGLMVSIMPEGIQSLTEETLIVVEPADVAPPIEIEEEEVLPFEISLTPSSRLLAPTAAELAAILRSVVPEESDSDSSREG